MNMEELVPVISWYVRHALRGSSDKEDHGLAGEGDKEAQDAGRANH